ncbi:MAG TPA: very short patch repair endonuclease [Caulobacteraceae bacterium]|nr:very short patch repair endonuclease [Caulobacteraceae bacterium]
MVPLNARTTAAMAKVKQARTTPEERVAAILRDLGLAYRRNVRTLPGKPDFANQSKGWAIQVHGCFWHQHDCKRGTMPSHNRDAWQAKFARNQQRDAEVEARLAAQGLKVVTVWECETKDSVGLKNKLRSYLE